MNKIEQTVFNQIKDYLISDGCDEYAAHNAAEKGLEFFNRGNHKDPFFDSLCYAGTIHAQTSDTKYKFKKPKKVGGKPFTYTKPKSRKHNKTQQAMF